MGAPFQRSYYAAIHAGPSSLGGIDVETVDIDAVRNDSLSTDTGLLGGAAFGLRISPRVDVEIEAATGESDASIEPFGTFARFDGKVSWNAVMINARRRLSSASTGGLYVGAGVGIALKPNLDLQRVGEPDTEIDGGNSAAIQFFVGGERALTETLGGYLELRHFRTVADDEVRIPGVLNGVSRAEFEIQSTSLLLGLRLAF